MALIRLAFGVFLITMSPWVAGAQAQENANPVSWWINAKAIKHSLAPGDTLQVDISADVEEGWHFYSITQVSGGPKRTEITVLSGSAFMLAGDIKASPPKRAFDPTLKLETEIYDKSTSFTVPVKVVPRPRWGKQELLIDVRFQACSERVCRLPTTIHLTLPVAISPRKKTRPGASRKEWSDIRLFPSPTFRSRVSK